METKEEREWSQKSEWWTQQDDDDGQGTRDVRAGTVRWRVERHGNHGRGDDKHPRASQLQLLPGKRNMINS